MRQIFWTLLLTFAFAHLGPAYAEDEAPKEEAQDTGDDAVPAEEELEESPERKPADADERDASPSTSENAKLPKNTGKIEAALSAEEEAELDRLLDAEAEKGLLGGWTDKLAEKERSYPYVEHSGYYRFRMDYFYNGHLGTTIPGVRGSGTSGMPAPLTENYSNNEDEAISRLVGTDNSKSLFSANMRFRYSPTLHISKSLRVKGTVDVLDNLVLGSTPDFSGDLVRPDVPLVGFGQNAASPSSGSNGFRDSIRVKELYGEFQPSFLIRVGRQASDWGLGILANSGHKNGMVDFDADFGSYADRALILAKAWDVYVAFAYDFIYAGAITDDPAEPFGQPMDMGLADNANQYVLTLFQRPLTDVEKEERRINLYERFKPTFDWGFYAVYRDQGFDLDGTSYRRWREEGGRRNQDSLGLVPRDAWAFIPDLWFKYEQHFSYYDSLRIELELTGIVGEIGDVSSDVGGSASSRELRQMGAALEVQYDHKQLSLGLDAGFATGDSAKGFGVLDRHTLAEADGTPNREVTSFKFNRNYRIDLLLFRQVIGAVTNAIYVKPWAAYDFFDSPDEKLGLRLDLLYAQALVPEATPGNEAFLGFETDLSLFFHNSDGFMFDLEGGLLVPGGAFNYRPLDGNDKDASLAFTVRGRFSVAF